jgi:CheY-like chemotaxis protein
MAAQRVVLIIEDDRNFSRILEAKLLKNSYSVLLSSDAVSGLTYLLERRVDVVLIDGRLPDADGLAALPLLRAAAPRTPFLFMTAYEEEYPRGRALSAGAREVLYKPFDLDSLTSAVARMTAPAEISLSSRTPSPMAEAASPATYSNANAIAVIEEQTGRLPHADRRKHVRAPLSAPIVLTPTADPGGDVSQAVLLGMSIDISLGGLGLVAARPLLQGLETRIQCALPSGGGPVLDARATVLRVESVEGPPPLVLYRMAVQFEPVSPAAGSIVEDFVAAARQN